MIFHRLTEINRLPPFVTSDEEGRGENPHVCNQSVTIRKLIVGEGQERQNDVESIPSIQPIVFSDESKSSRKSSNPKDESSNISLGMPPKIPRETDGEVLMVSSCSIPTMYGKKVSSFSPFKPFQQPEIPTRRIFAGVSSLY